jgi:hypothetical protein
MTTNLKDIKPIKIQNLVTKPNYAVERGVSLQTIYNWIKEGRIKTVEFMGHEYIDRSTFRL